MWCEKCNLETEYEKCPECHSSTVPVPENGVFWCSECKIPIMKEPRQRGQEQIDIICPICGKTADYLASDMRPVFPEERLLVELRLNKQPHTYINSSVWASNNRYYIDGKSVSISTKHFQNADADRLRELLTQYQASNSYEAFNRYISLFIRVNVNRLNYIKEEAAKFILNAANGYDVNSLVISFSGGKDSTVTADVVAKAFGGEIGPSILHYFGD